MITKLRRYGLEHCDLPTMVSNSSTLLRVLSLNLDPFYEKKIPIAFLILTTILFSCYVFVYVFSMAWFVFVRCMETGDVISAMVIFALGMSSEISTVKFVYLFVYQNTLRNMIGEYLIYDARPSTVRSSTTLLTVLRKIKKRALVFWCMVIGNGIVYCVKPLLLPGRHLMEDTEFLFGLEPLFETPNYQIGYFLSLGGSIFTVYATANISGFFIMVTGYIEAQMLTLSEELVNIWEDAQNYYYQTKDITENSARDPSKDFIKQKQLILNKHVRNQLRRIVNKHTTNINFLCQIETVFRSSIAIEFGFLVVSLIAEFLGGIENTYLLMPFALVQVTMDCITGQKLLDASIAFQTAVYDSKWENFDVMNMKTVLIMMLNAKRDMTLTVGGLRALNFLCLMDVFRMIYSTYTALSTMVNR